MEVCERGAVADAHPLSLTTPGLGHISFDVTRACTSLQRFLDTLEHESVQRFHKTLRVLDPPRQRMMGCSVVEVAFLADADGTPVELMRLQKRLDDRPHFDSEWS